MHHRLGVSLSFFSRLAESDWQRGLIGTLVTKDGSQMAMPWPISPPRIPPCTSKPPSEARETTDVPFTTAGGPQSAWAMEADLQR